MKLKLVSFWFLSYRYLHCWLRLCHFQLIMSSSEHLLVLVRGVLGFLGILFVCLFCSMAGEYRSIIRCVIPCMHSHLKSVAFCLHCLCVCVLYVFVSTCMWTWRPEEDFWCLIVLELLNICCKIGSLSKTRSYGVKWLDWLPRCSRDLLPFSANVQGLQR